MTAEEEEVYYDYTVRTLLHGAKRHRRSDRGCCRNCRCEDDHVIELRLVVEALNELPYGTYSRRQDGWWQRRLVDFFNEYHHNEQCLPHAVHQQKTHAVDKWIQGEYLTDSEMMWINEI